MHDTPIESAPGSIAARPRRKRDIKSLVLGALILFNVVLVGILVLHHVPDNRAQAFGGVNAAELLAVPGQLPGWSNGVVYLLDGRTGLLTAISYDAPSGRLIWMPQPIDIAAQLGNPGNVRGR